MENNQYNEYRYNRKKQWYRFILGLQQMVIHPMLNLIWLVFAVGVVFLVIGERRLLLNFEVYPLIYSVLELCTKFLIVMFSVISVIGIVQIIGQITAMKDEGDMNLVFGDRRDVKNQPPILISKKVIKKKDVTVRKFYSTIPMKRWQEKKEVICDIMNIHIIGEIEYGGKHNNNGNYIVIKSARGRKPTERGVLYDDTF